MRRVLVATAVLLVLAMAADDGLAFPSRPFDFFGEVAAVQRGDDWAESETGFSFGGPPPGNTLRLGPMTIELVDGTDLEVGAATFGGNTCRFFVTWDWDEWRPQRCVVFGEYAPGGSIAWYAVRRVESGDRVEVGSLVSATATHADNRDFVFPINADVDVRCELISDPPETLAELFDRYSGPMRTLVDLSGQVGDVECVGVA